MPNRKMPLDREIIQDYKTMGSGGMSKKYGVARVTVCRHLKRLKITRPLKGINSRNRKRIGEVFKTGYPAYYLPNHPRSSAVGYVFKHILEMEKHLGRIPKKSEPIHHIDLDRTNYHISNLYLSKNNSHHQSIHSQLNKVIAQLIRKGILKFKNGKYYA